MLITNPFRINLSKEFTMARFIQPQFATPVAAAQVVEPSASSRTSAQVQSESRTLGGMLLAAVLASLLVVANQLIDTWAEGHLLAAWVALWTIAFATLALLAPPLRQLASALSIRIARWDAQAKARRMEETMWEYAHRDPRVMAELRAALARSQNAA
jgi:hypothetical protein